MWEGEGDPVEGGNVWVECRAVITGVQKPVLRETTEDHYQANNVVITIWKIGLETLLSPILEFSSKLDWRVV